MYTEYVAYFYARSENTLQSTQIMSLEDQIGKSHEKSSMLKNKLAGFKL